jgi:AAA15 family ATPase/GTPase
MYTSLHIENFRAFKSLEVSDLARVNLISGENNVGKTSLLEAILIHAGDFRNFFRLRGEQGASSWFYELNRDVPIHIQGEYKLRSGQLSLFPRNSWGYEISVLEEISLELREQITREIQFRASRRTEPDLIRDLIVLRITEKTETPRKEFHMYEYQGQLRLVNERRQFSDVPSSLLASRERVSSRQNAQRFSKLSLNNESERFLEVLKVIDPRIRSARVEVPTDVPVIFVDIGLKQLIPMTLMGDGIDRVASILLSMSEAQDGVVLIDEIENGLHYSKLEQFWSVIYQAALTFNVQLFATTHSYDCIRAAHQAFEQQHSEDFRYHRLDRIRDDGEIVMKSFPPKGLELALELNYEVR